MGRDKDVICQDQRLNDSTRRSLKGGGWGGPTVLGLRLGVSCSFETLAGWRKQARHKRRWAQNGHAPVIAAAIVGCCEVLIAVVRCAVVKLLAPEAIVAGVPLPERQRVITIRRGSDCFPVGQRGKRTKRGFCQGRRRLAGKRTRSGRDLSQISERGRARSGRHCPGRLTSGSRHILSRVFVSMFSMLSS